MGGDPNPEPPDESHWDTNASLIRRYLWDGWRMLIEWIEEPETYVTRTYTWGLDLGGLKGAGGAGVSPANMAAAVLEAAGTIGGLLALHDDAGTPTNPADDRDYAYLYDGNGNVGQLVAWAAGYGGTSGYGWDTTPPTRARLVARYEYDPYGQTIGPDPDDDGDWLEHAGPYALENPFRFSTKYWDDETGLGYWGYRYYSPGLGRWVSRDPIEELGGLHLYRYVRNQPSSRWDAKGLQSSQPTSMQPASQCNDVCGLEIGERLKSALQGWATVWDSLSLWQRYKVCYGVVHHAKGWDIYELAWEKWRFCASGCGTGRCEETVQVYGRCYKPHHVNYVLWGAVRRLCGANWYATVQAVTVHRLGSDYVRREGDDPDSLKDQVEGRQLWTYLGLRGELEADRNPYLRRGVGQQTYCRRCESSNGVYTQYKGPLTIILRKGLPMIGSDGFYIIATGEAGGALYESDEPIPPD